MSILQIRAFTPQSPPHGSAAINRPQNRNQSGHTVDPNPKKAGAFLSTAWHCFTSCFSRPKRGAALSVSFPPNADAMQAPSNNCRVVSMKTLEDACKVRFEGMYPGRFKKEIKEYPKHTLSLLRTYSEEQAALRWKLLQDPRFCEKHKDASLEEKFILAEIEAHDLMQSEKKYSSNFLCRMEPLAEVLADRLSRRFGVALDKREPHWSAKDREILDYASGCVLAMKAALPKNVRSRISPKFEETYSVQTRPGRRHDQRSHGAL